MWINEGGAPVRASSQHGDVPAPCAAICNGTRYNATCVTAAGA
jgi:hypothetical protein